MARKAIASRFASLAAIAQSVAVAVAKTNKGRPGFRFPGMALSASARAMQVHPPPGGRAGFGTVLAAVLAGAFDRDTEASRSETSHLAHDIIMLSDGSINLFRLILNVNLSQDALPGCSDLSRRGL
jgi:hypothetical protein